MSGDGGATSSYRPVAPPAIRASSELSARSVRESLVTFAPPARGEQDRLAVPVLKAAWALLRSGWCRGDFAVDADGVRMGFRRGQVATAWTLSAAISAAGSAGIESEYARQLLRRLLHEHDLVRWNNHPTRTKAQVLSLLERAVTVADGRVRLRGGWRVSSEVTP